MTIADQNRKMRFSQNGAENDPASGRTPPPALLPLIRNNLPRELFADPQGVTWDLQWRAGRNGKPGGWTKPPKNPRTGGNAATNDPATWATFASVVVQFNRVGFVVTAADPYAFIDIDDAIDPLTGEPKPWAQAIVDRIPSYWERSPTNTGLKGLIRGTPPGNRIFLVGDGQVEVFSSGKYTTLSGHRLPGTSARITDCQGPLDALFADLTPTAAAPQARPPLPLPLPDSDDAAIIERVRRMPQGQRLYDAGDSGHYQSGSEADLALLNSFVAAGATDPDQLDRLYRASAIAREKWDRPDYRERTIAKALDGTVRPMATITRLSDHQPLAATGTDDAAAGDALPDDVASLKAMIVQLTRRVESAEARADAAEARSAMLSRVQTTATRILRNNKLGQERMTAVALTYRFANREAAGDTGDAKGLHPFKLRDIAQDAGVSEDAAAAHVKKLVDLGALAKEVRWIPERIDTETGEIIPAHRRQYIGPAGGTVVDFVEAVANLQPETPKKWGGARTACPDHPDAGIVKRWSQHCAECDRLLDKGTETLAPERKPHLAVTPNDDLVTEDPVTSSPPVDHYRYRNGRLDYNDVAGSPVAAAFLQGQRFPGSSPPPPRPVDGIVGVPA